MLTIPREVLEENDAAPASEPEDEDNYIPDEVETLFVRINSAGTPLAGEELIYSVYKSILPQTIDLVEMPGGTSSCPLG